MDPKAVLGYRTGGKRYTFCVSPGILVSRYKTGGSDEGKRWNFCERALYRVSTKVWHRRFDSLFYMEEQKQERYMGAGATTIL
jgi:hypothetical protein